jgi:hypothetical protein
LRCSSSELHDFPKKNKLIHIQKQRYQRFVKNNGGYTRAKVYLVSLPAPSLYISIKFKPFSNRGIDTDCIS